MSPIHLNVPGPARADNLRRRAPVRSGATAALEAARQQGDAAYDPRSAMTFIYEQGRNEQAAGSYILPIAEQVLNEALAAWNAQSTAA